MATSARSARSTTHGRKTTVNIATCPTLISTVSNSESAAFDSPGVSSRPDAESVIADRLPRSAVAGAHLAVALPDEHEHVGAAEGPSRAGVHVQGLAEPARGFDGVDLVSHVAAR